MMQLLIIKKNFLKKIFSIFLIFIFSIDAAIPQNKTLKLINDYLGDIRTLQANFSQTNNMEDIMTGALFLKKPGKIRFSYDPPNNLQIVTKQQAVLIFDPKNSGSGPLTYPMSSTPLGFLIKNDLSSLIGENGEVFELDDFIFLKVHNSQSTLRIEFSKNPLSLSGWEFKNQVGETIKVTLNNIKKNNYISNEIFKTDKDYERIKK
ncbi:MAG: outer-membrane lipoprotein carrier protein [Paracoccaceae bacterium]|nr:MAG: outer-membrane lipoprotein carrier protein [Paracoccaceae bacterium]